MSLTFFNFLFSQETSDEIQICEDINLIKLSDNAYIHVSNTPSSQWGRVASNGLLLIKNNEAFLFDTPMSDSLTTILLDFIENNLHAKIIGFAPNHWHGDCMEGLDIVHDHGIPSYANKLTKVEAQERGLPIPQHDFKDSLSLKLKDIEIFFYYFGPAHSLDNIVVWIPSESILFAGCMIKEVRATNLGFTDDGNLALYPETLKKIQQKFPNAKIVIPGHGRHGGLELVDHTIEMCDEIQ